MAINNTAKSKKKSSKNPSKSLKDKIVELDNKLLEQLANLCGDSSVSVEYK